MAQTHSERLRLHNSTCLGYFFRRVMKDGEKVVSVAHTKPFWLVSNVVLRFKSLMERHCLTILDHVLFGTELFHKSYTLSLSSKVGNSQASLVDRSIMSTSLNSVSNSECSRETACS